MSNKLFDVSVPFALENSSYLIVAADAQEAAETYVKHALADTISVDINEMEERGRLRVFFVEVDLQVAGVLEWKAEARSIISLSTIDAWVKKDLDGPSPV